MDTINVNDVRADRNSLGKASFIVGVIALVMSFIPVIGFVSWLLAPLAILFGFIAVFRPSKSLAIAGLVTGVIALFICFSWLKGVESASKAMSADAFNTSGETVDLSNAPVVEASIKGIWSDLEDNKLAAATKYGKSRLHFTNEKINEIGGDATKPDLSFIGKDEEYLSRLVSATFGAEDAEKVSGLKVGGKASFTCASIKEALGEGYFLTECKLD